MLIFQPFYSKKNKKNTQKYNWNDSIKILPGKYRFPEQFKIPR